eukprot:5613657-Pleurochrysis_carterae.AAC.6
MRTGGCGDHSGRSGRSAAEEAYSWWRGGGRAAGAISVDWEAARDWERGRGLGGAVFGCWSLVGLVERVLKG